MKTLYLIRHAKSDWSVENLGDIDRSLNTRGYNDAHTMSLRLKDKKIMPDLIVTSPAIRAISTALIFCRNLNYDVSKITINADLYDSTVREYLKCISTFAQEHKTVFLFGHNPIITNCANSLTKSITEEIPTCGIVGIKAHSNDWSLISEKLNELVLYDFPKNGA